MFADGGITALGANVFNMGVLGEWSSAVSMLAARRAPAHAPRAARRGQRRRLGGGDGRRRRLRDRARRLRTVPLGTVLPAMLGVHAVIAAGEAVTVAAKAVFATRPDLIHGLRRARLLRPPDPRLMKLFTILALAVAIGRASPFAGLLARRAREGGDRQGVRRPGHAPLGAGGLAGARLRLPGRRRPARGDRPRRLRRR